MPSTRKTTTSKSTTAKSASESSPRKAATRATTSKAAKSKAQVVANESENISSVAPEAVAQSMNEAAVETVSAAASVSTSESTASAEKAAVTEKKAAAKAKSAGSNNARPTLTPEQRYHYVEVAAYYIAERRGFAPGDPLSDWAQAEKEIDDLLQRGLLNP